VNWICFDTTCSAQQRQTFMLPHNAQIAVGACILPRLDLQNIS
jgi:hypothetical protein